MSAPKPQVLPLVGTVQQSPAVDEHRPAMMRPQVGLVAHHLQDVIGLSVRDDVADGVQGLNPPQPMLVTLDVRGSLPWESSGYG